METNEGADELMDLSDLELPSSPPPAVTSRRKKEVPAEASSRPSPHDTKRRRRLSASSGPHKPGSGVPKDYRGMHGSSAGIAEDAMVPFNSDPEGVENEAVDKDCSGCGRNCVVGRCWVDPDEMIQWALPQQRGLWCRDCFNLWRLCFQSRTTLVMLPCHLQSDNNFMDEWHLALLAYISLRRQGSERVSGQMLAERVEMNKFIMASLCVPIYDYKIVPLSEIGPGASPRASDLVTMHIDGQDQIGAMVRVPRSARSAFPRPIEDGTMMIPTRSMLFCSPENFKVLGNFFGHATLDKTSRSVGTTITQKTSPERGGSLSKDAKKVYGKLRSHIANAKLLLSGFESDEWEDIRETSMRQVLAKLGASHLEAAEQQVEWMIEEASSWYHGVKDTKLFVRLYREVRNTKGSGWDRFAELDAVSAKVYEFLQKHIDVSLSFTALRIKARFQATGDQPRSLHDRLTDANEVGLFSALGKMHSDTASHLNADSWMRGLVVGHIASTIEGTASDEVDDARVRLENDLKKSANLLRTCPKAEALSDVIADLEMVWKVCAAGLGNNVVDNKGAIAAKKHILQSPRLARLAKAFAESNGGVELMAPIVQMETKGVHDTFGDARFDAGFGCFRDKAMLRVRAMASAKGADGSSEAAAPWQYVLYNSHLATSCPMLAPSLMTDAMSQVAEAMKLWSAVRFDAMIERVSVFVRCVGSTFVAIDCALMLHVYQAVKGPIGDMNDLGTSDALSPSAMHAQVVALSVALSPLQRASLSTVVCSFSNLSKMCKGSESLVALVAARVEQIALNEKARHSIFQTMTAICGLAAFAFPENESDAIDQWVAHGEKSFLASAILLLQEVAELRSVGSLDFSDMCLQEVVEEPAGVVTSDNVDGTIVEGAVVVLDKGTDAVPIQDVANMPSTIADLPVVAYAERILVRSVSGLVKRFGDLVELEAFVAKAPSPPSSTSTLREVIQTFVSPHAMTFSVSAMSQHVVAKGENVWPSVAAVEILEDIMDSIRIETVQCSSNFVVEPGDVDAKLVLKMCEIYAAMHKAAAGLAWMSVKCGAECTSEHRIKPELEIVIDVVKKSLGDADELIQRLAETLGDWEPLPNFTHGLDVCAQWVSAVMSAFGTFMDIIVSMMVCGVDKLTKDVQSHTPKFEHYMNDAEMSKKLVKARLLNYASHAVLLDQSVSLFRAVSDVSRIKEKFKVTGADDDEANEPLAKATTAFRNAKTALTVLSAVTIVFGTQGPNVGKVANEFANKHGAALPKALLAELESLAGKTSTTKPKAKLSKTTAKCSASAEDADATGAA